jgi:hypothetical protein
MAHTDTVNSLNESINQSINRFFVGLTNKQTNKRLRVGWRLGATLGRRQTIMVDIVGRMAGRILSLVSFDVKGAFNRVHTSVLTQRLAERRVPKPMVEWIGDFVSNRHAQVTVGEYESEVSGIEYAGIPQGSPLSLLLYVFYNANLVEKKIDRRGGAIGFVDDFNAWVVGADESETIAAIQREIIPYAER